MNKIEYLKLRAKTKNVLALFNTLQECNQTYGYTAQQTLYEKKPVTYPRTDSQYLTENMHGIAFSMMRWPHGNTEFGQCCAGEPVVSWAMSEVSKTRA